MKITHYFLIAIFMLPSMYSHANINIELQDAKLPDIIQLFMKQIFKSEYILSPDLKSETRTTTVSLKNKTPEQAKSIFKTLMEDYSIRLEQKDGIVYVKKITTQTPQKTEQPLLPVTTLKPQTDGELIPPEVLKSIQQPEINDQSSVDISDLIKIATDADTIVYDPKNISPANLQNLLKFASIESQIIAGKVIFNIPQERRDFITNLIADFDKTKPDLVIKASLYEYTKRDNKQNAVDAVLNLIKDTLVLSLPTINITSATRLSLTATDITATFRALNSHENFKVLSSPTIRATDEKTSTINIGASVPVLNQIVTAANGNQQQSIVYRDSGITLQVTPRIRADNIELDIMQNVSDFTQTTTGVNNSPTLIQRRLETTLNCKNGDLILLGGLEQHRDENGRSTFIGIPTSSRKLKEDTDLLLVLHVTKI